MITDHDLQEAIAECRGVRNPTANTCIKLAAYYIIQDHLFGSEEPPVSGYSYAPAEEAPRESVTIDSDSEFSRVVRNMDPAEVWSVVDELMETLSVLNPRLYDGVMRKLRG